MFIQEKEKLYQELKAILARQPGPEVCVELFYFLFICYFFHSCFSSPYYSLSYIHSLYFSLFPLPSSLYLFIHTHTHTHFFLSILSFSLFHPLLLLPISFPSSPSPSSLFPILSFSVLSLEGFRAVGCLSIVP